MLEETKKMIEKQIKNGFCFDLVDYKSICQPVYLWTNENVRGYQNIFKNKNKALSVLSSGDQVFNMVLNGITNIDTFDNNNLTEYFTLGLKKAMILKYPYEDFLKQTKKMCSSDTIKPMSLDELTTFIYDLLPYMEIKYRNFWKKIIDFNYKIQKNSNENQYKDLFDMICANNVFDLNSLKKRNQYLNSKEEYELLRSNLLKSTISFKLVNALNLKNNFSDKYDLIFLSNILNYFRYIWGDDWNIDKLLKYINNLEFLLNKNGEIILHYVFFGTSKIFTSSLVKLEEIPNSKVITFDGILHGSEKVIVIKK